MLASAWEPLTASGTLALALVTAWLAWSTRRLAREAGDETRANWRPVLVVEGFSSATGSAPAVSIRDDCLYLGVHNIGRGPALVVTALLGLEDPQREPVRSRGSSNALEPGGWLTLEWRDFKPPQPPPEGLPAWASLIGRISYGDVSYRRHSTRIALGFQVGDQVEVLDVHVEEPAQPLPFARLRHALLMLRLHLRRWRNTHARKLLRNT
jgi:hypothetical protein